jgi:hypothetical protein
VAKLARATTGSTIHNTGGTHPMGIGKRRISLADVVRVTPVDPVVPEDPVVPAVRVALVVSEDPVVLVALVVPEDPAVPVALVVPAVREALVVSENPAVPEARAVPVGVLERELVQVEAGLVRDHPRVRPAVALRTKSVIAAHPHDLVPLLAAEEDLAAVAEIMHAQAAAEAVIAWAVADTAVAAAPE